MNYLFIYFLNFKIIKNSLFNLNSFSFVERIVEIGGNWKEVNNRKARKMMFGKLGHPVHVFTFDAFG